MTQFQRTATSLVLAYLFAGTAVADNLIGNPSFETVVDGKAVGWATDRGTPTLMTDGGHSGDHYVRVIDESDKDIHLLESLRIEVRPGGEYLASAWVRTNDNGGPGIYINFYTAAGVRIQNSYSKAMAPTNGWVQVTVTATAPAQAASVGIYLYSYLNDIGTFDFDDVSLVVNGGSEPLSVQHVQPSVTEAIDIGSRRELFVDRFLIDGMHNARMELHQPRDEGLVLAFDKPWEGQFCGYCTVLKIGDRYRVYYRGRPDAGEDGDRTETTCIAESDNGVAWTRPDVGLYEVNGTRENNIVLADTAPYTHNFSPFIDTRPGVESQERFKAICGLHPEGLALFVSSDGLSWKLEKKQIITSKEFAFDSQACAFWSATEAQYVCYFRTWQDKTRWVSRTTSDDCRTWSTPVEMKSDMPIEHFYTNQTHPYFRAPHLYISLLARFVPHRQVVTDEQAQAIGVNPKYFKDTSDAVFVTSRGTDRFDRTFMTSFVRPGIGAENWVSRTNYPALNLAQTGPHEMSMYVNQNYAQSTAHLRRYSMRLDGFASIRADYTGGELLTRPLIFSGNKLAINFSTSAAGSIRVEVQDAEGKPIPGFNLFECREQIGNEIERQVTWESDGDLSSLAGQSVRLRFWMKDADLFAVHFQEAQQ